MTDFILPIRVKAQWFAIDAASCVQVIGGAAWWPVPHRGTAARGVFFWRRQAIPVIDLGEGDGLSPWTLATRLVIGRWRESYVALACDEVREAIPLGPLIPLKHSFGEHGVERAAEWCPLVTAEGLTRRLERELWPGDSAGASAPQAAVLFQAGPVDVAIPSDLVERFSPSIPAGTMSIDPSACLGLPAYEDLRETDQSKIALVCVINGRRVAILNETGLRMSQGEGAVSVALPRFVASDRPLPNQAVLGWGRRPAIVLGRRYLTSYVEGAWRP